MDIEYKRDLDKSYMIIKGKSMDVGYEKEVLSSNDIAPLLSFYTVEVNGQREFWYDISGGKSLKDYILQEGVSRENILRLLLYIKMCFDCLSNYLISDRHILLSEESIFVFYNKGEFRMALCYYPDVDTDALKQLVNVFAFLMEVVRSEDEEARELVYRLYEMSDSGIGIDDLLEMANGFESHENADDSFAEEFTTQEIEEPSEESKEHFVVKQENNPRAKEAFLSFIYTCFGKIKEAIFKKWESLFPPKTKPIDFVFEPDAIYDEPTVMLKSDTAKLEGHLIYEGDGSESDYIIEGDRFTIGTNSKNNAVLHSKAVSRFHGVIERDESGLYYISDLNSTNGTLVNGQALEYNSTRKLSSMDEIIFADVCYRIV